MSSLWRGEPVNSQQIGNAFAVAKARGIATVHVHCYIKKLKSVVTIIMHNTISCYNDNHERIQI